LTIRARRLFLTGFWCSGTLKPVITEVFFNNEPLLKMLGP